MKRDTRFPPDVEGTLREMGWFPGRQVSYNKMQNWSTTLYKRLGYPMFPVAYSVLKEFGDLEFTHYRRGVDYRIGPFILDPMLSEGWEDYYRELSESSGELIYPVGFLKDALSHFGVRERGDIIAFGTIDGVIDYSIEAALVRLLRGENFAHDELK